MDGVDDEGQMGREERRRRRERRQVEVEQAALLEELGKTGERGKRENPRMFSIRVNQLC